MDKEKVTFEHVQELAAEFKELVDYTLLTLHEIPKGHDEFAAMGITLAMSGFQSLLLLAYNAEKEVTDGTPKTADSFDPKAN